MAHSVRMERPVPPPGSKTLFIQKLDATYYTAKPHATLCTYKRPNVPIIKLYGVSDTANSVLLHIHDVVPYFYIGVESTVLNEEQLRLFMNGINRSESVRVLHRNGEDKAVVKIEQVAKRSVWGYQMGNTSNFLKIQTALPHYVPTVRRVLEQGVMIPEMSPNLLTFQTFESNVPFVLRYMIDYGIAGGCWLEISTDDLHIRHHGGESNCQIEADVHCDCIIPHTTGNEWMKMAPLRIMSFDIECSSRKNHFPEAEHDSVIQIANVVQVLGEDKPMVKAVFTLKSCAPIAGAHIYSFEDESDMLVAWRDFMITVDPDVITGYNIINFDLPYLINRARALGKRASGMLVLGRTGKLVTMKDSRFSSKAYGTRETKEIQIEGRLQFDMLPIIQREYKLRSYSLNSVSAHFLKSQKEDVHYSIISDLQNGTAETRRRLAVYCLKDAVLPLKLMDKLMILLNYIEMARVTGVPILFLLTRGQQIKVLSQLYRKAASYGFLIPVLTKKPPAEETYEGATVLEPVRGFHTVPVATLDFSSLYPSIMIAHNLCYTTLVHSSLITQLDEGSYCKTPTDNYFVKADVQKGLLPEILIELLEARKVAKRDMKAAKDRFTRDVLNCRQLALKISANSVYGFTGAVVGQLPCLPISGSVTAFGREMIMATKKKVEEEYKHAQVIYGDTDSVMIKFGTESVEETMALGLEAAKKVTTIFEDPIRLEFEKVYYPYLLMNKKRYAGLYWTNSKMWSKLDAKGIETVRRDNCPLVKTVVETVLHKVLVKRNVDDAVDYVKGIISDLLCNRMDLSQLVITKALGAKSKDYKVKLPHVELAKRMQERDPGNAPHMGDRVAYVITAGAKGAAAYERAEDPNYVLEHGIAIDTNYYLENQLSQPLTRIFEPILGDARKVLEGQHTRSVKRHTSSLGIMKFAVKKRKCLGCKVPLGSDAQVVCSYCEDKVGELYLKQLATVRTCEDVHSSLWTECQRCQGSLHQDVICSNNDCPIFYRRKKAQIDLKEAQEKLERFCF